jgi:hypothetical protein
MPDKVLQMGYMSGDTYTAAVWLKLNPGSKIVLIKDTKEPQDKTDKVILSFYKECGVQAQVKVLDISGKALTAKAVWGALKESSSDSSAATALSRTDAEFKTLSGQVTGEQPRGWPRAITAVTGWVSNAYDRDPVGTGKTIAALWKVAKIEGELFQALDAFLTGKFSALRLDFRDNFVVLWSRQSGKGGGAHVELDSSFAGIRQLARYFAISRGSATVLLAGDERNGKLAALAAENPQIVDVSRLWAEAAWTKEPLKSSSYLGQFAFFRYMADNVNVIHVGMRSGILEAMALMGMKTFYLEPTACPSGKRMVAFHQAGIPYSRVQIEQPAGLTAWDAQCAIERGVPAPTLGGWLSRLQKETSFLMGYGKYRDFYYSGASGRRVFNQAAAQRDAPIYAKAKILAEDALDRSASDFRAKRDAVLEDLLKKSPEEVKQSMSNMRGFSTQDLETITRAIEGELKR